MKVGLLVGSNLNPVVFDEYVNFANLIQKSINEKMSKNNQVEVIEINKETLGKVEGVDVVVLSGGEDVHPEYYNSKVKYNDDLYEFNRQRDEIELELLEKFHKVKPIFGICRGIQVINVFFKGTLFQHLPYDLRGIVIENAHKIYPDVKRFEDKRKLRHIIKGKVFELLNFKTNLEINNFRMVNSRHHQAVAKLGNSLEILAISRDGIVEILKHSSLPILAVQYHPEQKEIVDYQYPLIDYFVNIF